jgi:hypothetical protein
MIFAFGTFLSSFNRRSLFLDDTWSNNHKLNLYTDASGAIGFGTLNGAMGNGRKIG